MTKGRLISAACLAALAWSAPAAVAAPPANDARVDATPLTLPASVSGTTRESTLEPTEIGSFCGPTDGSVWYRFTAPAGGAAVVQFDAGGDLDANVDVYERVRSQLNQVDCAVSDRDGQATLNLDDLEGQYLIRVGARTGSDPGGFSLKVLVPGAPARPPGRAIGFRAVRDSVEAITNPSDAYSVSLTSGTTYRLSLKTNDCVRVSLFAPGTRSFDDDSELRLRCGGYRLFTPEESGRFPLEVASRNGRGTDRYRLQVGLARADDTTPGIFIRNDARVRGRVNGKLDSVDLYRFDVTSRSSLNLRVSGGPELTLLRPGGRRLDSGTTSISQDVGVGRYYVAVRGAGRYTLRRISKTITRSAVTFNGRRKASIGPGGSAALTLAVSRGASGRSTILLQKFDPLAGWQFLRRIRPAVVNGRARVTFTPPSIGRYRAIASFDGSKLAAPSDAGQARLRVVAPLQQ